MFQGERDEVDELIRQINNVAPVKKIYLFGSYAYGKPNKDSDIDLCIIVNDSKTRKRDLVKNIRKSISKVAKKPVDILVYDQEQFLQRAKIKVTIEYKIFNEGVSVYE